MEFLSVIDRKKEVGAYRTEFIREQEAAVAMAEEIIRTANEGGYSPPKASLKVQEQGNARLAALRAGFLPTVGLHTAVIPTLPLKKERKDGYKWVLRRQREVLAAVGRLPVEIKEAIAEAESLGMFDKIAISQPGGDPVIVGCAGGWKFLIASWVNLVGGEGVGFRFHRPVSV